MSRDILRGDRLKRLTPESIDYTASTSFDGILVKPVVKINMAHMVMLINQGVVSRAEGSLCLKGLREMPEELQLDPALEDVHMNVESFLVKKIGGTAGGQLNLAKSRNDQVATAIRMALREYLVNIVSGLTDLRKTILDQASKHINTLMPGYTHLQHAQPTTLAHHFLAYHDALQRDSKRLIEAYGRVNLSPLGAVALASTGVKIDRAFTRRLLGFDGLLENSIDAVSSRDFAIEVISDLALAMTDLSKIAEEMVLWSSSEFSVMEISDGYASTSSVMPQKKNAVVAELIRGKTSTVYGDLMASISMTKALPYSYNIDLQQLTPHIWSACSITLTSIRVLKGMIQEAVFNKERLKELLEEGAVAATDLADYLAVEHNIPFRTAHTVVGSLVRRSVEEKHAFRNVILEYLDGVTKDIAGVEVSITPSEVDRILDPAKSVETRTVDGGPSSIVVKKMIVNRKKGVKETGEWASQRIEMLEAANQELARTTDELIGGEKA
ncbi:MAG: argininosuccinate lyase [Thaumarchaeota archaeon]|nr:argininosuccinate lyase [Nitrososphaerota archaeon]MCL5318852.1 argininosuccinate lyase [Nitrososphaerota archaeon]